MRGRKSLCLEPLARWKTLRCKGLLLLWRQKKKLKEFKISLPTGHHSWAPELLKKLHWCLKLSSPRMSSWHWRILEPRALEFLNLPLQVHRPVLLVVVFLCLLGLCRRSRMLSHGCQKRKSYATWFLLFMFENVNRSEGIQKYKVFSDSWFETLRPQDFGKA